jgi:hypothetical protein
MQNVSYKASFNGIERRVYGVYTLYGLTPLEVEIFRQENDNLINGSGSSYTIYKDARRYIYVKLYIHSLRKPILIDILPRLLGLTGKSRISQQLIDKLADNMPKIIFVKINGKVWDFEDPFLLEDALRRAGY